MVRTNFAIPFSNISKFATFPLFYYKYFHSLVYVRKRNIHLNKSYSIFVSAKYHTEYSVQEKAQGVKKKNKRPFHYSRASQNVYQNPIKTTVIKELETNFPIISGIQIGLKSKSKKIKKCFGYHYFKMSKWFCTRYTNK